MAAATCVQTKTRGHMDGTLNPVIAFQFAFVADSTDGSYTAALPSAILQDIAGILMDVGIVFGSTGPDSLDITITDGSGRTVYSTSNLTASQAAPVMTDSVPVVGDVSVIISGNTTNSAAVNITLYLI